MGAARRVTLTDETNLHELLEQVHEDGEPRVIERNGEAIAVVMAPGEYSTLTTSPTSARRKRELLAFAGVWRDLDADEMIEKLYQHRHESPPSPPLDA